METLADRIALIQALGVVLTFGASTCYGIPSATEQVMQLDSGSLRYTGKDRYFMLLIGDYILIDIQVSFQFTRTTESKVLTYEVVQAIPSDDGWVKVIVNLVGVANV